MGRVNRVKPHEIPKLILLRFFRNKAIKIKFINDAEVSVDFYEYKRIVSLIDSGHWILGQKDEGFLFDFYGYKLFVPRNKLKWMPAVLDKSSPYWKIKNISGKTVLDVGGFLGESALFFLSKGAKEVFVVEPIPENVEVIRENLRINGVSDKVEIYEFGIGDVDGFVEVEYEEFGADFGRTGGKKRTKIKVKHIDEVLKLKPDLVKFNCEGCERFLLKANPKLIREIPEWYIQTHGWNLENEIKELMLSLGFETVEEFKHKTKSPIYTFHFSLRIPTQP
ncbi:MAG: FkbM family methyltransferase [candidate division WOR-3 bacterium]